MAKATPATLEEAFKNLRVSRGRTQKDIALTCDYSLTVPWKVEHGRPVRWETLHTMLVNGLKVQPGSPDYQSIHKLWLQQRQTHADTAPPKKGKKKFSSVAQKALSEFRNLIRKRSDEEVKKILAAATRQSAKRVDAAPPVPAKKGAKKAGKR